MPPNTASAERRHSYITHLLEDGADQLFVQQQVGHRWGSSTAGYTKVGSDYLQAMRSNLANLRAGQGCS